MFRFNFFTISFKMWFEFCIVFAVDLKENIDSVIEVSLGIINESLHHLVFPINQTDLMCWAWVMLLIIFIQEEGEEGCWVSLIVMCIYLSGINQKKAQIKCKYPGYKFVATSLSGRSEFPYRVYVVDNSHTHNCSGTVIKGFL